jgi:hypothetical protein
MNRREFFRVAALSVATLFWWLLAGAAPMLPARSRIAFTSLSSMRYSTNARLLKAYGVDLREVMANGFGPPVSGVSLVVTEKRT